MTNPKWDITSKMGFDAETSVSTAREAFANGHIEVKLDRVARKTGNVYVETYCRRGGQWTKSGINETEAHCWAFVLRDDHASILVVTDDQLRQLAKRAYQERGPVIQPHGSHPTRGVTIPIRWFYE